MSDLPNPSFIVINVSGSAAMSDVVGRLSQFSAGEGGNPLTPLGSYRYVMSRAVSKRIRTRETEALGDVALMSGVELARFMRADQIMALYGALDPANPVRPRGSAEDADPPDDVPWHHAASLRVWRGAGMSQRS